MNAALARYRYVLFFIIVLAMAAAVGYGLTHLPPPLTFTVLPPPPTALPTPIPTAAPVRCHVVGPVQAPGVYTLAPGSRVQDAIKAAGGATADADLERLDLAAIVQDQQQIVVPKQQTADASGTSGKASGPINVNTANSETLQTLPGIGPAMASRIIEHRETNGPFETIEGLIDVKGIGEATLEKLRPLVTVGP